MKLIVPRRRSRAALMLAAAVVGVLALWPGAGAGGATVPSLQFDKIVFKQGGGEPDMTISPSGKVMIVAGLGPDSPAALYRSTDYGKTFKKLAPEFPMTGGGDWDMYMVDDKTVVAADLTIGDGIYIHRSNDAGDHWTTTRIENDQYDRPWLDHFGRDVVYVVAKGFDSIPYLYRSDDGGESFGAPALPLIVYGVPGQGGPSPTDAFVTNLNAYVDHLVVDQHSGDVYVLYGIGTPSSFNTSQPAGASNALYVAHLEDGKMISYPVYIGGPDDSFISGFNWMTVDRDGTLYVLVDGRIDGHHSARLTYSKDHGKTWSKLADVAPKGAANVYGAIASESPGVLSMAYIRGTLEDPNSEQPWYAEMARITAADTPSPKTTHVRPFGVPIHLKDICFDGIVCGLPGFGNDRNLLDFIWVSVDPHGKAYGVFASDGPATGTTNDSTPDVLVLRQTGTLSPAIAKPAAKPRVLGTKTTNKGRGLAATGLGEAPLVLGSILTLSAAALGSRLRLRR
jgi:hypothetical protein